MRGARWRIRIGPLVSTCALCLALGGTAAQGQEVFVAIDGESFAHFVRTEVFGSAGDVAFDPTDDHKPYFLVDDTVERGGGLYELVPNGDGLLPQKILPVDRPSSLTITPDGDLWIVRDFSGALAPHVSAVRAPRAGPPYVSETVIRQFLSPADDDPVALSYVPVSGPAGAGAKAQAGDLIIADRGVDGNERNGIYAFTPADPQGDPEAYDRFLASPAALQDFDGDNLNDVGVSPDGSMVYAAFHSGRIVQLSTAAGEVVREVIPDGVEFSNLDGIAVHPVDGRLWVADDTLDAVWSLDPRTFAARREIRFFRRGETRPGFHADFHDPGLRFSDTGDRLAVSDSAGWLWIFFVERPQSPWFKRGDADAGGTVNIADPIAILNFLFASGPAPSCVDAIDFDDGGSLNVSDAIGLLNYLIAGGLPPAPPGPTDCGPDPSADELGDCVYPLINC